MSLATYPVPTEEVEKIVCGYWRASQDWNMELLESLLPRHTLDLLQLAQVSQQEDEDDGVRWKLSGSGQFISCTAYQITGIDPLPSDSAAWRHVWKAQGPHTYFLLLWKARWDKLKVNQLVYQKGIRDDPYCDACHGYMETRLHALRDSPSVEEIAFSKLLA